MRGMGGLVRAAALVLALPAAAAPPEDVPLPPLPAAVEKALAGPYAGWHIPTLVDREGYAFCARKPAPGAPPPAVRHPYLVSGDFDGDGRADFAAYFMRERGGRISHAAAAMLADGRVIRLEGPDHVPDRVPLYFLDVTPKGEKLTSVYSAKSRRLATDAVDLIRCEAASRSLVYDSALKRFRAIQTSD